MAAVSAVGVNCMPMPDRTPAQFWLDPRCCNQLGKDRAKAGVPVRLECVTEDGEEFAMVLPRRSWALLLLGDRYVPGWVEPTLALDNVG